MKPFPFVLVLIATAGAAAAPANARLVAYGGQYANGDPVALTIENGVVRDFASFDRIPCASGPLSVPEQYVRRPGLPPATVSRFQSPESFGGVVKRGRFALSSVSAQDLGPDRWASVGLNVTGSVSARLVRGTSEARANIVRVADGAIEPCAAPARTWTAQHRRNVVYSGANRFNGLRLGGPIVLTRNIKRRTTTVNMAWAALVCEGRVFYPHADVTRFRKLKVTRSGSFIGRSQTLIPRPEGTETVQVQITGRFKLGSVSGRVAALAVLRDPSGAEIGRCGTTSAAAGGFEWGATS